METSDDHIQHLDSHNNDKKDAFTPKNTFRSSLAAAYTPSTSSESSSFPSSPADFLTSKHINYYDTSFKSSQDGMKQDKGVLFSSLAPIESSDLQYEEQDEDYNMKQYGSRNIASSSNEIKSQQSTSVSRRNFYRSKSVPVLNQRSNSMDEQTILKIFPDINHKELRLAEVKSWHCPWRKSSSSDSRKNAVEQESKIDSNKPRRLQNQRIKAHSLSDKRLSTQLNSPNSPDFEKEVLDMELRVAALSFSKEEAAEQAMTPPPIATPLKRPQLHLKLENMPTSQQAEARAQKAAARLTLRMKQTPSDDMSRPSLRLDSYASSGDSSNPSSPNSITADDHDHTRHSAGSAYSPNHGMFTTKNVVVYEAGISSPDTTCLHLQENLERVKEIGRGASGVVYKAVHVPTLKVVAVKDVPVYARNQRRQMVRELHALHSNLVPISSGQPAAASVSPCIVSFYDAYVDRPKNCIGLVMEYMNAGSLQDMVLAGGCQDEAILSRFASYVLKGLAHIHRKKMVHRDIKPHNLLANRQGQVKISDFGLARTLNDTVTNTKTFVGTLLYMAPERIRGEAYSYPADVWSFGLSLVCVALGKYPLPTQDGFFGLVDSEANQAALELPVSEFSPECREFVAACLDPDPETRPTATMLLAYPFLQKYTDDESLAAWSRWIDSTDICEDREEEVMAIADAVYRHLYEKRLKFSYHPQSEYGYDAFFPRSIASHECSPLNPSPCFPRRDNLTLEPIQRSLQFGLSQSLGVYPDDVYSAFESKRKEYNDKLLEEYCYSPQSWTASPGINRRMQMLGQENKDHVQSQQQIVDPNVLGRAARSPRARPMPRKKSSNFWHKVQASVSNFASKTRKKKNKEGNT